MGLPVAVTNFLVLVYLNGLKVSSSGDYELEYPFIRFSFNLKVGDRLAFVVLSSDDPLEFELELPHSYDASTWFNLSDPAELLDSKIKKIEGHMPTVTQL